MIHGNGVGDGQSLPATTVPETARTVPCHLNPAQVGQLSVNGKVGESEAAQAEAVARVQVARAKAKAEEMKAKAEEAKARANHIEAAKANELANEAVKTARAERFAKAAEAEASFRAKRALEAESIAVARARAQEMMARSATKAKMATVEALEADLKIVKLRKELEVLTGESEVKEYLCILSLRPSLCPSLTACFSDLNSSPYSVFASVFLFFFLTGVPLDGRDEEQNSGTVLLEDSELNKQKHSSPRSPRFSEDSLKRKRIEPSTPDCSSR